MAMCAANASMGHHGRKNYCGNLLWQSSLTLLFSGQFVEKVLMELKTEAVSVVLPRQSYVVMGTGTIGGENYCGNLLWQSCLTL